MKNRNPVIPSAPRNPSQSLLMERLAGLDQGDSVRWSSKLKTRGGKFMSIAVGQAAPDFTLLNQDKKEVKLSDFAGKKNVVLV